MKLIYENTIKSIGSLAEDFLSEKMIILFGEHAPADLKDFCFGIDVLRSEGKIEPGQNFFINNEKFSITSVGNVAQRNLEELGHITLKFDGSEVAELPGTIYLEKKEIPSIELGTTIGILEE